MSDQFESPTTPSGRVESHTNQAPDFTPPLSSRLPRSFKRPDTTLHLEEIRDQLLRRGLVVYEMQSSLITQPIRPTDNRRRGDVASAHPPNELGPTAGDFELRKRIAIERRGLFSTPITAENVKITGGARHALHLSVLALAKPREEVIVMPPCWGPYEDIVRLNAVTPRLVPLLSDEGYQPNTRQIADCWSLNTRAILTTTPNNPTGTVISAQNLRALQDIARINRGTLIVDETFEAFNFRPEVGPAAKLHLKNAIVVGSFSETFSIPELRAGYMIASPELIQEVSRYERCLAFAPPRWVQKLGLELLANRDQHLDKVRPLIRERQIALKSALMSNPAIQEVFSEGGTFLWVVPKGHTGIDCRKTVEVLAEHTGVLVMPGAEYRAPGCFRLGVGQITNGDAFRRACDLLSRFSDFQPRLRSLPAL